MLQTRALPIGAEMSKTIGGASFRVWAPRSRQVAVEFFDDGQREPRRTEPLAAEGGGYFSGHVAGVAAGARYQLKLDRGSYPDPASRFQPDGPHGASELVEPAAFRWTDHAWRGRAVSELVIYELHVGTFTREGTWQAAAARLPALAELGVTMIEVMPIAEFPGRFGWGYDGVDLFAPTRLYGRPEDARAFVNRAHELGLAVILDVVYNHFGPDGNYLREFSGDYFSARYKNEWGDPLNFDGENSAPVREFFVSNARYWIQEYHLDGLRFDATQQIFDASRPHVLAEIAAAARTAAPGRTLFLVAENETQQADIVRPRERGGHGFDAIWNDDFHHTARVSATGRAEAYYSGYRGTAQEMVSATKHGFLYQGQWSQWQRQRRGSPAFDLGPHHFVSFLENHDQVANSLRGRRVHQLTSPARLRALTALLLLSPQIPMLFQGQEFAAATPFLYFADHAPELAQKVEEGRRQFLRQFPSIAVAEAQALLAPPHDVATFERSKLDWTQREQNAWAVRLHADLLRMRRTERALAAPARFDGAVLGERAFVLRFFAPEGADLLLLVNLAGDLRLGAAAEPLLAPLAAHGWRTRWSSESSEYGGDGAAPIETKSGWMLPANSAVLLTSDENCEPPDAKLSEKN